jgi:hypothetical protein
MTARKGRSDVRVWLGQNDGDSTPAMVGGEAEVQKNERHEAFGGGKLWIGRHTADQDTLVFDPTREDASAQVLALYSLTQHRLRSFPRATVLQRIEVLTDELAHARAKRVYARRTTLRAAHEQARLVSRTEGMKRQRDGVLALHRRYVEALGLTYHEVRDTPADHKAGRRTKCHACGIGLDDFANAVCGICSGVLCSCGACACGNQARLR